MLKNIIRLEKQVCTVSQENRVRRSDVLYRCRLLGDATTSLATQPTALGITMLFGFYLGLREKNKFNVPRCSRRDITQLLSLGINFLTHLDRCKNKFSN